MTTRWFDRTFTLGLAVADAAGVISRLRSTPDRLHAALEGVPEPLRVHRPGGRWSMQEHAGHLFDLDVLFDQRLDDFDRGAETLRAADLENRRTHEAGHNERAPGAILDQFRDARAAMVARLDRMGPSGLSRMSRHPRLGQPMSVVDLCYFIAEHDDHHLAAIADIAATLAARPQYALDLVNTVERAVPRLTAIDEAAARTRPTAAKWSPAEIVGHLVDSASNNHQRFVRAATVQEDLVFPGYAQDDWVAVQRYSEAPWLELVGLWRGFNHHLARVMAAIPAEARTRPRAVHTLRDTAYRPLPPERPATLDYFMEDYVGHLQHHLRQIWEQSGRV